MLNGVTFWTEGGACTGMGHLIRSINIARALGGLDAPIHFLVNNDRAVIDRLEEACLPHIVYPVDRANAVRLANDLVVIDTKKDVTAQVRRLKDEGKKVVLIDNRSGAAGYADMSIFPDAAGRPGDGGNNCYSGSEYVIIGGNFLRLRKEAARAAYSKPLKVLVTMGGADPLGLTDIVAGALTDVDDIEVTVVMGPASRQSKTLQGLAARAGGRFRFVKGVNNLAPLMNSAHVAFSAVGTTVYELAFMGVPSVLIGNYPDDKADITAYEGIGISRGIGFYKEVTAGDIAGAVEAFKKDENMWREMSRKASGLIDGYGAARIAALIENILREDNQKIGLEKDIKGASHA